ncbi:MAG: succinyl-diaminopimelate desuccinylase, partial [Gammaproteobacteria bacterium]|nr:succinyl-diaminopimelate desuccinylase [Gammaproteobacteria bacterium]
ADMKGGIAAMVTACERFLAHSKICQGSVAFLLTSDEEGPAVNGTRKVIEHLQARGETIAWCLLGEPSSDKRIADQVKNGRRGSLNGRLLVRGEQGHVAYPHLASNPIHRFAPVLQKLCETQWDKGNAFFPPASFQVSNIHAGTGITNVVPGELEAVFNFRYGAAKPEQLQQRVAALLEEHGVDYKLEWEHSGSPFLTADGSLLDAARAAVHEVCG